MRPNNIYTITTLLCLVFSTELFSQSSVWMEPGSEVHFEQFFDKYSDDISLSPDDSFELIRATEDHLGIKHFRYQQYHNNVEVEGSVMILHCKNDRVYLANGNPTRNWQSPGVAVISEETALDNALDHFGAEIYAWQSISHENLKKRLSGDENETWFPEGNLVYANEDYNANGRDYVLAYKFEILSLRPHDKQTIFVDAQTGEILFAQNGCLNAEVEGTAETMYHGTVSIITDSIAPDSFRLLDMSRGGGIETWNLQEFTEPDSAVHFYDSDNYWDNFNTEMDHIAGDVHWSSEVTYDYFMDVHERDSYDGEGSPIVSYVHYGENVYNAFWNGSYASYGDGGSEPFTYIDIIAHELTHGVTGTSAGLIYANESGALNESFSDIFGAMVEFYGFTEFADWNIGSPGNHLRSMSDPNTFNDPDTYNGDFYYTGEFDNGGVHINSSVQNFWFYLLSEGGAGTNSLGNEYDVDSLGMDKASAIAFRNLTNYLFPGSTFMDARLGSLYSAEDLYGSCSPEVITVGHAWYAVGVGEDQLTHDLRLVEILGPTTSCELGDHEEFTFRIIYNGAGCGEQLTEGDEILTAYRINGESPVFETIQITETVNAGDTIDHVFSTTMNLEEEGLYEFDSWVALEGDLNNNNDSIFDYTVIHIDGLDEDELLGFQDEDYVPLVSYFYTNWRSQVRISPFAGSGSSRGCQINGRGNWNENNIDWPTNDQEVWEFNPQYGAKLCICMDTEGWDNVRLSFDLKQTFSPFYLEEYGEEFPELVSSLRVLVDDEVVSPTYHPITYDDDDFLTRVINLDEYAGTQFEICFEGKHFIRKENDPVNGSDGDNSYIDNIFFTSEEIVNVGEEELSSLRVYPNPSEGILRIDRDTVEGPLEYTVYNALGMVVKSAVLNSDQDLIDLTSESHGVYTLVFHNNEKPSVFRVVLE